MLSIRFRSYSITEAIGNGEIYEPNTEVSAKTDINAAYYLIRIVAPIAIIVLMALFVWKGNLKKKFARKLIRA